MRQLLHDRRIRIALLAAAALLVAAAAYAALTAGRAAEPASSAGTASSAASGDSTMRAAAAKVTGEVPLPTPAVAVGQGSSSDTSELNAALPPALDPQRYLVRTGDMGVIVAKGQVPEAAARVVALTTGYGGYVLSSQLSTAADGGRPFADITVRVPARLYDQAIRRFGALGKVQAVHTSADDVTGQYVDLRARLTHERKVERRLLGFLARATSVDQALAVQSRIDATELKIEQLAGQLKALREQVVFGTLTVSVTEKAKPVLATHRDSFTSALLSSWRHVVAGFAAIVIGLGAVLPFAVLLAVLIGLTWLGARAVARVRRHVPSQQPQH